MEKQITLLYLVIFGVAMGVSRIFLLHTCSQIGVGIVTLHIIEVL
ncbi:MULTISPECIES: hypothetical protein [Peribacillus]|uniref:Uncharacterized protein n=1 Tax=Peribacillus castrilensis TaxID=2897690 RepID=A0AAW9N7R5_9BACI|nr:hypothetical protein [Peribacillus frigoritolerans]MEC0272931.1 hypothetical protein [Peribacillus castrilensis]